MKRGLRDRLLSEIEAINERINRLEMNVISYAADECYIEAGINNAKLNQLKVVSKSLVNLLKK